MLKVVDIVKAQVKIQSNLEYGSVEKLSCRSQGPYKIINNIGHNSFELKNWVYYTAAICKYKTHQIYFLPRPYFPVSH